MTCIREKTIKPKLGLLNLATQLGSVSQACNIMGYSRNIFSRFSQSAINSFFSLSFS